MTSRLRRRLAQARDERRGVLFGFLPAGFPDPGRFRAVAGALFDAGLDALEVSMPGPAPALDGPLIQDAAQQAGQYLSTVDEALALAAGSRRSDDDTIIALAYLSAFDSMTPDEFLDKLAAAGVDAFLLPQHPVDEQLAIGLRAQPRGIDPVIFLHREVDLTLLHETELEHPVIYLQSASLQTGGQFNPDKARERMRDVTAAMSGRDHSICVGFGVRGYDEVREVMATGADGAIIGTRLVVAAEKSPEDAAAIVDEVALALVRRDGMSR